jgi:DNA polymerase-1
MPKTSEKAAAKPAAVNALKKGDHVFLVDGSSYIFRAYHALPPLTRKSDGLQVNAVLGFCNMLWKLLRDMPPKSPSATSSIPTTRRTGRRRPMT